MPASTSSSVRRVPSVDVDQRDDERVLRLPRREPALGDLLLPAQRLELLHHPRPGGGPLERGDVAEPAYGLVGDALLDLRGAPAPGHHRRTHPDAEGALAAEVVGHRREPGGRGRRRPSR